MQPERNNMKAEERQCYRQIVTDTKLSNASHLFFINFNNNRTRRLIFDFLPISLCTCVYSKSACASVCKYVFFFLQYFYLFIIFFFLHKFLSVSVSMSLFVGLFACYSAPLIIFGKYLYSYCQFRCCSTTVIFINHHPSFFCFCFFSFFHPPIGEEFKTFSSSGMVYPYPFVAWVSRLR